MRPGLTRPPQRVRRILLAVGVLIVLLVLVRVLMNLRVSYLFFDHLGHTNVFWTPFVAQVILFLVGFVITAVVVGVSIPGWRAAARTLDVRGGKLAV